MRYPVNILLRIEPEVKDNILALSKAWDLPEQEVIRKSLKDMFAAQAEAIKAGTLILLEASKRRGEE